MRERWGDGARLHDCTIARSHDATNLEMIKSFIKIVNYIFIFINI